MLFVETKERLDYNKFDNMSTEALKAVLQADFDAPEAEQLDIDTIMYITNLLTEREKADLQNSAKAVADAKAEFYREYYPLKDNKGLVQNIVGDVEETVNSLAKRNKITLVHQTWYKKVAGMVAAILIVFCVGSVTAYALGIGPIAKWNEERFWFETINDSATVELITSLQDYGIDTKVVPVVLPSSFKMSSLKITEDDGITKFSTIYDREKNNIVEELTIDIVNSKQSANTIVEKDTEDVIEYKVNGVTHYIMDNLGTKIIVWNNNNIHCCIGGHFTESEAKKMIDSIYKE